MTATKEQERKALEKIRKIIAELGEDSYVGIAFDGCAELAEQNIENDFGLSMKANWEAALAREEVSRVRERDITEQRDELLEDVARLQKQVLTIRDLDTVKAVVHSKSTDAWSQTMNAGEKIVELADQPDSVDFRDAVALHRRYKKLTESYDELYGRLDAIRKTYDA